MHCNAANSNYLCGCVYACIHQYAAVANLDYTCTVNHKILWLAN